jgi:glycerol uptake facilitator-like aquaporin
MTQELLYQTAYGFAFVITLALVGWILCFWGDIHKSFSATLVEFSYLLWLMSVGYVTAYHTEFIWNDRCEDPPIVLAFYSVIGCHIALTYHYIAIAFYDVRQGVVLWLTGED